MISPLILIVSGARQHPDPKLATSTLSHFVLYEIDRDRPVIVRHGDCPGEQSIDQAIARWIEACGQWAGVTAEPYPADWDHCAPNCPRTPGHRRTKAPGDVHHPGLLATYCPAAGPRRNSLMVGARPRAHYALVFPDPNGPSRGTRSCARLCRNAGIDVREVRP